MSERRSHPAQPGEKITLRVAGGSNVNSVAGAIAKYIAEGAHVTLVAIGAGAINQMTKATCIARGMVGRSGHDLLIRPGLTDEMVDSEKKTAVQFILVVS